MRKPNLSLEENRGGSKGRKTRLDKLGKEKKKNFASSKRCHKARIINLTRQGGG